MIDSDPLPEGRTFASGKRIDAIDKFVEVKPKRLFRVISSVQQAEKIELRRSGYLDR